MRKKQGVIWTEKLDASFGAPYEARGIAIGEARGKIETGRNMVLTVLRERFKKVPKTVEKEIRQITDLIALELWAVQAATCPSIEEFLAVLK